MRQKDIDIIEAIIREAVIENHIEELRLLEEDTTPVTFSEKQEKQMRSLFTQT